MTPSAFIAAISPAAKACMLKTGIPASFTIAQAALESSWGHSLLANSGFNLFGVKADPSWTGARLAMNTGEFIGGKRAIVPAEWRVYTSWQECIDDHVKFFKENKRYSKCFDEKTGEGWARAVAAAGFATDPAYASKLIAVIRSNNLTQYDNATTTTTTKDPS